MERNSANFRFTIRYPMELWRRGVVFRGTFNFRASEAAGRYDARKLILNRANFARGNVA